MKIFVIGLNKTGTCSLHSLFIELNINSTHSVTPVMDIIDKFDAFTDGDHTDTFTKYYKKFPDSLFILNTRPIANWLISRYKHAEVVHACEDCWCWPVSKERTNGWITNRETLYTRVFNFFLDKPNQLLIVNIEKPGWETAVSTFIQKPYTFKPIHENAIKKIDEDNKCLILENVLMCLAQRGYNGNELLSKSINIRSYNYKTFL